LSAASLGAVTAALLVASMSHGSTLAVAERVLSEYRVPLDRYSSSETQNVLSARHVDFLYA
jgi:hypothetical protein